MIAVLLAAATAAVSAPFEPTAAEDPTPALAALGPQPAGGTAVTAWAGRPFHGVRVDHGFGELVDLGLGVDVWPDGFWRPALQARLRAVRTGRLQLTIRGMLGRAMSTNAALIPTTDGELAVQVGFAPVPRLAAFAEASLLGATDFTREHTAGFTQAQGGLAFAPPGPFSLLAAAGVMQGARGARVVGSGGAVCRF